MSVIDSKQAEANDDNLSPSRYISNGETKAMREFPEIVKELAALKKDEANLDADLETVLAQLCVTARAPPQSRTAPMVEVIPANAGIQWPCTLSNGNIVSLSRRSKTVQSLCGEHVY